MANVSYRDADGVFYFNKTEIKKQGYLFKSPEGNASIISINSSIIVNRKLDSLSIRISCDRFGDNSAESLKKIFVYTDKGNHFMTNVAPQEVPILIMAFYPNDQVSDLITCELKIVSRNPDAVLTKNVRFRQE